MSPQRVIRPAARRSPAGAGSLLWTAAAAALPVIVTVLVLVVLTLGVLLFSASGFESLFAVVAVEWLVVNRVPLAVDSVELGFLPLLPPLIYVAILARQTRAVLADVEQPGGREAAAVVAGASAAGVLLTGLASLLVGSSASDFAVREFSLPVALLWTAAVGLLGSGIGVWLFFRRDLRENLPLWVRGGIHLGVAFVAATWAISATLVLIGVLFSWESIASSLEIGKGFVGTAALTGISVAYLPNVVVAGAALAVGGEAHLGEASYSVFAVSRGPMPEVPLAAALPTTNPHWIVQGLLLVTVVVAAVLARSVAHWFRTTADAVKAVWLAAAVVAVVMAVSPVVAGGQLGVLGPVGTGGLIAAVMALLLFGIIGSTTIALSLAGLTRRRERAESELARRRRRVGGVPDVPADEVSDPGAGPTADTGARLTASVGAEMAADVAEDEVDEEATEDPAVAARDEQTTEDWDEGDEPVADERDDPAVDTVVVSPGSDTADPVDTSVDPDGVSEPTDLEGDTEPTDLEGDTEPARFTEPAPSADTAEGRDTTDVADSAEADEIDGAPSADLRAGVSGGEGVAAGGDRDDGSSDLPDEGDKAGD